MKRTPLKRSNKPLSRTTKLSRIKVKSKEEKEQDKYESAKMTAFFLYCLQELGSYSDVSDNKIYSPGRGNYHHCLRKELFPNLKYSIRNILVVTLEEHEEIHNNLDEYDIVKERMNFLYNNLEYCIQENNQWSEEYDKLHK